MAIANEDGSIVLSTKVDTSGIDSFLKKINQQAQSILDKGNKVAKTLNQITAEINKAENSESKRLLNAEKLRQEQEKTAILEQKKLVQSQKSEQEQIKINVLKEKENKAIYDSLAAESKAVVAEEKITAQKKQTEIAEQKKIQAQEKTKQITEATKQAEEKTEQAVYKTLKAEEQVYQAQEKTKQEVEKTKQAQNKTTEEILRSKNAQGALLNISKKISSVLGSVAAQLALAFSVTKIIQFSNEAGQLATQTEASVQRLVDIYGSASDSVGDFIDANARALGMSKAAAASFSSVYGNLFSVWADQATNAELTNRYLNMTAVVASKTGRTVEDVQERVRSGLLGNTEAIEDLGIFVNVKTIEMTDAFQRMANGKSWEQLDAYTQQQIRSMAILEQATAKYGDEVADTSATIRNRFNAAYQDFQNSWGNIVNTVLLPVLETLTQIFDIATKGLNALSGMSGQILENVELQEENTDKTAENIEKQVENQKDLNKEMKKTLAGFDDVQILSANTADNTGGGGGDLGDLGLVGTAPDGSAYVEEINKTLTAIMSVVAVSMIAIGLILLFTGNIAWGLGTIIFGVALEGVTMAAASQTDFGQDIIQAILTIQAVASGALLAIGIMLCFLLGPSPVTIGLIVAGSLLLIESVGMLVGLNPNDIATWLSIITGIAGGAMLALGIILCMVGSIPVGVGLIIAGVASLGFAVALNFDAVVDAIQGPLGKIMAIVGGALLVLGIILVCTGVGIPLGIALIATGAASLVTVTALNWNAIVDWVKGAWEAVKAFWNTHIAQIFTARWWLNLGKNCINGLIAGFEGGINGIINAFENMTNWIVDGLNKISFDIPDWLGGGSFGINIPNVSFGRVSIPRLAQGAVIPPNREFLAVLGDQKHGTNIEAPLQTIVDAFNIALQGNASYGGGNTEVVLEIDGREFGRAVVEQGNRENRRIGTRLVIA